MNKVVTYVLIYKMIFLSESLCPECIFLRNGPDRPIWHIIKKGDYRITCLNDSANCFFVGIENPLGP